MNFFFKHAAIPNFVTLTDVSKHFLGNHTNIIQHDSLLERCEALTNLVKNKQIQEIIIQNVETGSVNLDHLCNYYAL